MLAKDQQNNYRRFREQDLRIPSANPLPSHSNFNSQDEGAFCSSKLVDRFVVRCISTPFLIFLGCVFARAQPFHFCNQRRRGRCGGRLCVRPIACQMQRRSWRIVLAQGELVLRVLPARIHGLLIKTIRSDIGRRRARGNSNFARTCRASAFSSVTALLLSRLEGDRSWLRVSLIYIVFSWMWIWMEL